MDPEKADEWTCLSFAPTFERQIFIFAFGKTIDFILVLRNNLSQMFLYYGEMRRMETSIMSLC